MLTKSFINRVYSAVHHPKSPPQSKCNTFIPVYFSTRCFVIHPVLFPNKGPLTEQYLAQQAIGLASSLNWEIVKGPFWNKSPQTKIMPVLEKNQLYLEPIYDQEMKDGSYINGSLGKGVFYNNGIIFDAHEEDESDDLHKQWKDKILRESLANSALTKCKRVTQKFYFSKGKVEQIVSHVFKTGAHAIFINTELKPGQIRNLKKIIQARLNNKKLPVGYGLGVDENDSETELETSIQTQDKSDEKTSLRARTPYKKIKIFDRFSIILQIFAQRSTSKLAKLQIQLSYLNYLKTRLVRDGSTYSSNLNLFSGNLMSSEEFSLEIISAKQRRALGVMSGEGQSQLEIQKRNIKNKEAKIRKELQEESRLRNLYKEKQRKNFVNVPIIALVGYTNVGKSALMNFLMKKQEVQSQDLLFQTLKTTTRHIFLPSGKRAILLDTIGFITNLPVQLIDSFKATLEDISHADIVLHLKDISNPQHQLQKKSVLKILKQLKFEEKFYTERMIEVWNKIDLIDQVQLSQYKDDNSLKISCSTGENIRQLLLEVEQKLKTLGQFNKFEIQYSFDIHYKVLEWLKQVANLSEINIGMEHNYEQTQEFPAGSVKIEIQVEESTYWKLIKFMEGLKSGKGSRLGEKQRVLMQQKKQKKRSKGMPPKQGW